MTKQPVRDLPANKASVGSRSFNRTSQALQERSARRKIALQRALAMRRGSSLGLKALIRRVPSAAWMCALIALLNGVAWSIITPPFQGRDEPSHFAYVQQLAETGTLPRTVEGEHEEYSPEETSVLAGLQWSAIRLIPQRQSLSSVAQQRTLQSDVNAGLSREGSGEANVATSEPPLYYALQTVPYALGANNALAQLQLMRLFDALLGALTVLLAFAFIREVLPGVPWAATVGALCISVQPLFGFMSGTLNPEVMLYAVSAALFLCLARAFRRGLTRRGAIVFGAVIAVGFLTKLTFAGVAFGVFAGLIALGLRGLRSGDRRAVVPPAIAAGIGAAPVALYALVNSLSGKPSLGYASTLGGVLAGAHVVNAVSYIWELYLPRLPAMTHYFSGVSTFRDIWFDRFVGLYGWLDTQLPLWVDSVALIPAAAIALLCVRALIAGRRAVRARWLELASYAAIVLGLFVMVGAASYSGDGLDHKDAYADPRYLLSLLPLLGVAVALAVRGAGRRLAPVAGAVVVVAFLSHDIFSQLQEIARYYG